jgi:two-component system CheB/CheR fusion protein
MAARKPRRPARAVEAKVLSAGRPATRKRTVRRPARRRNVVSRKAAPIVGVGASAGGFEAFREFLKALPRDTGFAFVLVQHLDPGHQSMLTRLLSKSTAMMVSEVTEGMEVEPNHVYVIPPNATMSIRGGMLHLLAGRKPTVQHLPIDHFLRSLAEDLGNRAIGVILSGTASDGTMGLKAIKAEGGITFAQNSSSAKYDGMPRSAVAAGCVDFVLPPDEIASELARIGRHPYLAGRLRAHAAAEPPIEPDTALQKIFALLRNATGVDFAFYKDSTIKRRILRRMVLHKSKSRSISVLSGLSSRKRATIPDPVTTASANRSRSRRSSRSTAKIPTAGGEAVRVWVSDAVRRRAGPSCSRYSAPATSTPIQIGTDIQQGSIEKARAGLYSGGSLADVAPERLRFFVKANGARRSRTGP